MSRVVAFKIKPPMFVIYESWVNPYGARECSIEYWTGVKAVAKALREAAAWARIFAGFKIKLLWPFYFVFYFARELVQQVRNVPEVARLARCGCCTVYRNA